MELSDCPNLVTDWIPGDRTGPCEDCGHPKNKHPRQQASDKVSNMLLTELLKKQEKTMSAVKKTLEKQAKNMEKQAKNMEKQAKIMEKQVKTMEKIGEVLEDFCDKDCYDRISETSRPRELTFSAYEKAFKVPVADLKCMVTGVSHTALIAAVPTSPIPPNPVTLSHLLARNAYVKERDSLGYKKADIDNIRNTILLCKGIEEAFNQKNLSFVPTNKPFSDNRYKLHIWSEAIKNDPIYPGAAETIGSFDGVDLDLNVGSSRHNPFKRVLSYQAFRAFKKRGKDLSLKELPEDSDTSVYQGDYKRARIKYAQQLANDVVADAEDDEEQDEAVDEESDYDWEDL